MNHSDNREKDVAALRRSAEKAVQEGKMHSLEHGDPLISEEMRMTFHGLTAHQIELEMQNEKLRRTQAELDDSRARYFDLYDQAPVGYCTLSEKGLILEGNLTATALLGLNRNMLVNQPFSRFILKEDLDVYYLYRKHLFEPGEPQEIELRLVKLDGTLFWVHLAATAAQAEDDAPVCRIIFSDITKRKGVERELIFRESIIKSSSCAIATCDLEGKMTYGNPSFLKLWEFNRREDFLGKPFHNFWILNGHDKEVMRALQSEGTWEGELKGVKKDGSLFDVQVSAATVFDNTGSPVALTSTSIDITERKRREIYHGMGQEILRILNEPGDLLGAIERVIVVLKTVTGVDAIGLRLQEGEDFPYFSQDGFSQDFLLSENTLIKRGKDGGVCRDKDDNICLECTCGLVISGKIDPSNPLFTKGGSFWTNDSFPFLELPSDQDPRLHPRNICIHQGYASVALIPVRTRERIVGLIQLNDKRKDLFTLETIEVLEGIAVHIGSTLMRKHAEEALRESEERFKALHNASFGGIAIHDQGVILECNQGLSVMTGFDYGELIGMDGLLLIAVQSREAVMNHIRSGYEQPYEAFGLRKNGEEYPLCLEARNIPYKGKMVYVVEFRDITERKRAEEALKESEFRARAMLHAIPDMMFRLNSHGVFLSYKAEISDLYAQEVSTIIGKYTRDILPPEFVELTDEKIHVALETDSLQTFEYQLPVPGRGMRDYECRMIRSAADEVTAIVRDITERKRHEQQLAAALSEKEVLLREVHHRVKNNLAAIISLMDMQRRNLEDPNGQIILAELSSRISSMSLIHEKLYRADSLATIDFHDYIQALISHLRTTFGSPDIICQVDAPGVTIPLDLASPCGLIVNELVTNALKYAFPNGKPRPGNTDCRILICLHRDNDTYTLTVADNGIGWPAGFDWKENKNLGMTLVRMLGQHQLGGRYVVDQENGTSITLTFTDRKKEVPPESVTPSAGSSLLGLSGAIVSPGG
jgi:PAS domain S-box-containing protein